MSGFTPGSSSCNIKPQKINTININLIVFFLANGYSTHSDCNKNVVLLQLVDFGNSDFVSAKGIELQLTRQEVQVPFVVAKHHLTPATPSTGNINAL